MKKTFRLGLTMLGLFSANVYAQEVCNTVKDCQGLIAAAETRSVDLLKNEAAKFTEILKTGGSQRDADKICRDKGMRLPTAWELALLSQSLGSQGVRTAAKDGYSFINVTDVAGNPDNFYFSSLGYKRPQSNFKKHWFWSSSVYSSDTSLVVMLNGYHGYLYPLVHAEDNCRTCAVICVK